MLSGRTSYVDYQDQMVQPGNYCSSSIKVMSLDKKKKAANERLSWLIQTRSYKGVRSVEFKTLASEFEKLATEPKSKPNLDIEHC